MASFDTYLKKIKKGAQSILNETLKKGTTEANEIFEAHLKKSEEKLARWTNLLERGELTDVEFVLLVNNQVTLSRMRLRTIKVIGKKSAIEFRDKLRALFINTAFDMFL